MKTRKTDVLKSLRQTALIASAVISLMFLTNTANASCFDQGRRTSSAIPKGLLRQMDTAQNAANGTIAGLWHATYTTSDNQLFQESFDMWHLDGTELESANVNPIGGNFCLGVWKQLGSQIRLHHVGWAFDNVGNLVGPFTVDQTDVLGVQGNSYTGSFEFKLYDTSGNLLQEVTGTIAAIRIAVN